MYFSHKIEIHICDSLFTHQKPTMTKIMIFDTETSGLIPKDSKQLADYPHILQVSFIIYNDETEEIEKTYNTYVNAGIPVPEKITDLTGITQNMCDGGKPIINVLYDF